MSRPARKSRVMQQLEILTLRSLELAVPTAVADPEPVPVYPEPEPTKPEPAAVLAADDWRRNNKTVAERVDGPLDGLSIPKFLLQCGE